MKADPRRTLIVIPARGGSKRLPRKNVLSLGGKPLICHATDVALAAGPFGQVLLSTDDDEIAQTVSNNPAITIDDRDPGLAEDKTKVIDVMLEICRRENTQPSFDVIGMLLPTCPLRSAEDVRSGFNLLNKDFDAVVSFTEYEFSPLCAVTLEDNGRMSPSYTPSPLITGNTRSQDQAPTYRPNGAFFFAWIESLIRLKSFYTGRVRGFVMPRARSIDIDTVDDFAFAEWTIQQGHI